MENTGEYIVQGWHIAGFIWCFALGGFLTTSLILPKLKALQKSFDKHELRDKHKAVNDNYEL